MNLLSNGRRFPEYALFVSLGGRFIIDYTEEEPSANDPQRLSDSERKLLVNLVLVLQKTLDSPLVRLGTLPVLCSSQIVLICTVGRTSQATSERDRTSALQRADSEA